MKKLLLQLDTDKYASTFDRITAYEAGVDHVLSYGEVTVDDVQGLLHGVMFTRTIEERRQTAVFIGGRRVDLCEQILEEAKRSMFDPFCLSIMLDSNGCNTASAAAVALVKRHIELKGNKVAVLGGFGPVGLRAAKLLSGDGAKVYVTNLPRDLFTGKWNEQRARHDLGLAKVEAEESGFEIRTVNKRTEFEEVLEEATAVIATGPAGMRLISEDQWKNNPDLRILCDLNVAPPFGIEGIEPNWKAREEDGRILYGGLGIGHLKMRVHKRAIMSMFEREQVLNVEEIYALAKSL